MPCTQTIQMFLPAGDPRGMRVAEITTRNQTQEQRQALLAVARRILAPHLRELRHQATGAHAS